MEAEGDGHFRNQLVIRILAIVTKRGYLSIIECMLLNRQNKTFYSRYNNKEERLRCVAECHCAQSQRSWEGHSTQSRFRFWKSSLITPQVLKFLNDFYGIGTDPENGSSYYVDFYARLASLNPDTTISSPGQMGEIMRDVRRTFPSHPFFREGNRGSRVLGRVLR